MKVKFCKDCVYSFKREHNDWDLKCNNPVVNSSDYWALATESMPGTDCRQERQRNSWFSKCGMKGKLYEAK